MAACNQKQCCRSKPVTSGELYLQTSEPMCPFIGIKSILCVLIYSEYFKLQTHTLHAGQ